MPVSPPAFRSSIRDDRAVSEVIGHILIFGILSTVLILSLLGFTAAKQGAVDRVVEVRGESVAGRVAGSVVEAALFAEQSAASDLTLRTRLDLPDALEGRSYQVDLDADSVFVTAGGSTLESALFSSGDPADVVVCDQAPLNGGPMDVVVTTVPTGGIAPAVCSNYVDPGTTVRTVHLEVAS